MINSQTNSYDNMVNLYNNRLNNFDIDGIIRDTRHKLDQWHEDCHQTINAFFQQKSQELDSYINEAKNQYEIKKASVQSQLDRLKDHPCINLENIDLVKVMMSVIERDLTAIEQTCIQINLRPLVLDDNYIQLEKEFTLRNLSLSMDCPKFGYTEVSSSAIASNERFLLMHQYPYLSLIDHDSKIVKQSLWTYGWIRDMCWSSTLCCFIIITTNQIYITNEQSLSFAPLIDQFQQSWFSCTCSDKSLYLSTCEWGSAIFELSLSSSFDVVNQWKSPSTCENYEGINDIQYNNESIALMIKDSKEHKRRMELKSTKNFDKIWLFPLSTACDIRLFTCCPLKYNEWLLIDGATSEMYHIAANGKIKDKVQYNSVPYRANLFRSNILAVSAEFDLNLHKFSK
jgi:hypothetical protein